MVKTLSCGLRDPGSIPGRDNFFNLFSPLLSFSQDLLPVKSHQTIPSTGTMLPSPFLPPMSPSHGMYEPISPMPGPTDASL